jgi:hypothetical protein
MDSVPIVCDMTSAPDTGEERLLEYRRLFGGHLVGRERTATGIRFRLRADKGVEAWVRDLTAREQACCPFFGFRVATQGDAVIWDSAVVDDEIARAVLDEYYDLPVTAFDSVEAMEARLRERGLRITTKGLVSEFSRS